MGLLSGALNMNIFLFLLLVLTIISVSAEKSNLDDPVLFCDGCFALVSEIEKDMSVRSGETLKTRLERSLTNVCSTERLRAYKFSPPTQVKTCSAMLAKYRNLLTSVLRDQYRGGRQPGLEQLTDLLCTKGTKACKDREVPTLVQRREREEAKKKAEESKTEL